jgi:hypothetical protein
VGTIKARPGKFNPDLNSEIPQRMQKVHAEARRSRTQKLLTAENGKPDILTAENT